MIEGQFQLSKGQFELNTQFCWPGHGVTALLGASASGKTTLLRCIAGLEQAALGKLSVNGSCWQDHTEKHFLPTEKRGVGYVFQEASLFPHLSVRRNLAYGWKRTPVKARRLDFDQVVQLLDLPALLHRRTHGLSGGERQRVALARALLGSPLLLLLDEPLAGLDADRKAEILPYLKKLHQRLEIPMIYVSHQPDETAELADHIACIEQGQIVCEGHAEALLPAIWQSGSSRLLDRPFNKPLHKPWNGQLSHALPSQEPDREMSSAVSAEPPPQAELAADTPPTERERSAAV